MTSRGSVAWVRERLPATVATLRKGELTALMLLASGTLLLDMSAADGGESREMVVAIYASRNSGNRQYTSNKLDAAVGWCNLDALCVGQFKTNTQP